MEIPPATDDDGSMDDTPDQPGPSSSSGRATTDPPDDAFDPHRLRTITDMRRSKDDRMLAGVCAGAAKYLNVDPVVIRVVIAVLTFVGLSGLILYLAAWFFLPSEDEESVAASWFNLDKNEEQVRVAGLVVAGVLAALAIVGENRWSWWGIPWIVLPLAFLYWLFVVRPHNRRRDEHMTSDPVDPSTAQASTGATGDTLVGPTQPNAERRARQRGSGALTALTMSAMAIAVAIVVLVNESTDVSRTTYLAVALGVVAAGVLVGTFFGRPGPLIPIGLLLAAGLVVSSLMPSAGTGEKILRPTTAAGVEGEYKHGLGVIRLDLSDVDDVEQLLGSTIRIENGAGDIKVTVPDDLNVAIDAQVDGGEIRALGRRAQGTDASLVHPPADPDQPALTFHIRQTFGGIEVIER